MHHLKGVSSILTSLIYTNIVAHSYKIHLANIYSCGSNYICFYENIRYVLDETSL